MKYCYLLIMLAVLPVTGRVAADIPAVDGLLREYAAQGATSPDARQGRTLWINSFKGDKSPARRSCSSCHTANLKLPGKHIRTGKAIEPMAPSVNPKRLRLAKQIRKWFRRNCKWTLGRECTAAEKADLLMYLKQQ